MSAGLVANEASGTLNKELASLRERIVSSAARVEDSTLLQDILAEASAKAAEAVEDAERFQSPEATKQADILVSNLEDAVEGHAQVKILSSLSGLFRGTKYP